MSLPKDFCFFFLEHQLTWLNKEYNSKNWITYPKIKNKLITFLSKKENTELLTKNEQCLLSLCCIDILSDLDDAPNYLIRAYKSQKNNIYASKNVLNKAFKDFDIGYQIVSKQVSHNGTRTSAWYVIKEESCPPVN